MEEVKIIIRDDDYTKIQTPLNFAYNYVTKGIKVDILFLNIALLVLTEKGSKSLRTNGRHSYRETWLKKQLAAEGTPTNVHYYLKKIKLAGRVNLYGCKDSARLLKVAEEDLIPEAEGLVDSSIFIENRSVAQYFLPA